MTWNSIRFLLASSALAAIMGAEAGAAAETMAAPHAQRALYAVNEAAKDRGSISVYDIDAGHRLIKTIKTVPRVGDVRGVAASGVTGKLYAAYRDDAGTGMLYCLDLYTDAVLWNRALSPGVDRLAIKPDGQLLYVPTWEGGSADFINIVDAATGDIVRHVKFSSKSHDTQYPLSGPIFQETKDEDSSGNYLYLIDPNSYAVSRIGPYAAVLGPYAVDGTSSYVVNNVKNLWGMQVADLETRRIITARIPEDPPGDIELMHGIGWTPNQSEVWESSIGSDPHVFIWNMSNPIAPVLKEKLALRRGRGSHWLTFDIKGDYGYVAPLKNGEDGTEVFDARSHASIGVISSSEDMLEIDFEDGKISQVGDQFGIGRR